MTRRPQPSVLELAERLDKRDRSILAAVDELRLLRGDQVRELFFHGSSNSAGAARLSRRSLARLVECGLLARLEGRRVGGIRAGSNGHVYALTAKGRRLHAHWTGTDMPNRRGVYEPGLAFVEHTLAIGDLYVALVDAQRSTRTELLAFEGEPGCWRTFTSPIGATITLKPDAYVRLGVDEYEYASFVEVDRATHGKGALLRKAQAYLDYYRSGREQSTNGVFPKVVWITPTPTRARYLRDLLNDFPQEGGALFATAMTATAVQVLSGGEPTAEGAAA